MRLSTWAHSQDARDPFWRGRFFWGGIYHTRDPMISPTRGNRPGGYTPFRGFGFPGIEYLRSARRATRNCARLGILQRQLETLLPVISEAPPIAFKYQASCERSSRPELFGRGRSAPPNRVPLAIGPQSGHSPDSGAFYARWSDGKTPEARGSLAAGDR